MVKTRRLPAIFAAAMVFAWAPVAYSASPATDADHEKHHPAEQQVKPQVAAPQIKRDADLDAQVAHLRAIRERLSRATTPEERQALLAERNKVMQDAMAGMHKEMMGTRGHGGMASGMSKTKSKAQSADMQMCHDMMGQHMALMEICSEVVYGGLRWEIEGGGG
ncbi:hypothetical protein, partial [Cupriavidus necator]